MNRQKMIDILFEAIVNSTSEVKSSSDEFSDIEVDPDLKDLNIVPISLTNEELKDLVDRLMEAAGNDKRLGGNWITNLISISTKLLPFFI